MKQQLSNKIVRVFLLLLCSCELSAAVKLPYLVSDGMVLQRNTTLHIWGWASVAEKVTVRFMQKEYSTVTGAVGRWDIQLPAMKEGGPYSMDITASNHITINNILIGDVWVCSGQSNMTITLERVKEKYPAEIASSENRYIRHFFLPTVYNFNHPMDDTPPGKWESASPATILKFTAVGYFFAKKLYDKYHVPIGLVNSSVGGPPVESWMSSDALKPFPNYLSLAEPFKDSLYIDSIKKRDNSINNKWTANAKANDAGLIGLHPWFDTTTSSQDWSTMQIPGYWSDIGLKGVNGILWFRKEINIPDSLAGKPAKLFMGRIIDADVTYVNGVMVGNITYQYPPRRYEIPANLLKAGKNIITVRVTNSYGKGGFVFDKPYFLSVANLKIDLKGTWQYKLGVALPPLENNTVNISYQPIGLYNAMIAPLTNYNIKGVLWYQGEGNTGRPGDYNVLFSAMIADWRSKWGQGNFPFLFVQLPNFGDTTFHPTESNWANLREQQLKTLTVPNTAMIVAIDLGEWNDLHPLNKKDIGERLALAARNLAYHEKNIVYSGPLFQSVKKEGNKLVISFSNTGGGLTISKGDSLKEFAIAGADHTFVWANALIKNGKVVVWNDAIADPVFVRYAWANNPAEANLYNKEGLPASPFQANDKNVN